ncbi:aminotransferase class I/II-fold pyridoxal phosphate-dependent enzyme [Nocardioides panacihumi]|uniref:Aminotransferase n=2 Tax=Nocardioides panacihumi TaxID=400774 RepID=A0ABP5BWQ1_9ACTN
MKPMTAERVEGRWGAASRANVPPFHVMDMIEASTARQRTHGDALNLLSGQPSTGAPAAVAEEAVRLLRSSDPLGYTPATGILELREAIAGHYGTRYDLDVSPDDVVVTTGASGGFLLAFLAAFEVGDRVAMARPNYPCYRNVLQALGCEVVEIETGPETRFQPTVEQLDALHRAGSGLQGVLLASPANPTGTMVLPEELAAIAAWCEEHRVQLISDEIYHGIEYAPLAGHAALARCAWETSREAVVFGSFSKYFSMTGWRIGWLLAPRRLRRPIDVLTGNFTICPPTLAQRAAVRAFTPEAITELDGHVTRYAANRALLLDGLPGLGITRLAPADGAFYVYADVGHLTDDTMAFAHHLLATTGVAVAPGIDFDTTDGGRFLRMSFAGDGGEIREALERLSTALAR